MARPSGGAFVGLDIGTQTIKVVEARGAGANLQISGIGIENTPPGAIQGGLIADPKALGAAIKALLSRSGVGAKRCVSSVAGAASVVVRVIEVPRMTPAELGETMKWEVERHIPFAANDVEMAYQPIDDPAVAADPNNPNMEVLLAVAQRDMVAQHIQTIEAAGLTPVVVDVEPLAAGRALINLSRTGLATKNVVIVNIGAANTDVGVFKSGVLRFPRAIPLAGDNFTQAIANHLGLSMDAAEEEKRENAAIFMDLIGAPAADFNPVEEPVETTTPGGRTPFDFSDVPFNTPFGEPEAATPPPAEPAVDAAEEPASPLAGSPPPAAPDDNPFRIPAEEPATPFTAPVEEPASPFNAPPSAGPPAPVPDDPRSRRRREIFDAILPVLGELSSELRRSIDYFRSRYPNEAVDQIILCGGSSRIPNLDAFVQSDLGIPTTVADPFAGLTVSSRQVSAERLRDIAPAFAVAVGLAARDALLGPDK